jgi:PAS domain S-box-containing protein
MDRDKTRMRRTVHLLSLGLLAASTVSLAQALVFGWHDAAWTLSAGNLCLLAALWTNHRGHLELAAQIIAFSELACGLLLVWFGWGFSDEEMLLFPLVLVIAAVLLHWRAYVALAATVLVSLAIMGLVLAQEGRTTRYHTVVNALNILVVTGAAVGLLAHSLRTAAEQATESERRFRELLENVQLAALMFDVSGTITFCNDYLLAITGWTRAELIGHSLTEIVAPEHRDEVGAAIQRAAAGEAPAPPSDYAVRTKTGQTRWVQWNHARLRSTTGKSAGFASVGVDITDHRALEEQYLQAQKLESVGRLAGGVAHDFNNLLTVVNGYSDMVLLKLAKSDPLRAKLQQIRNAGGRAAQLTQQLLAFSRKQVIQPRPLNLNAAVEETQAMLRPMIGEDIEMVVRLDESAGQVLGDPAQMAQLLMNLAVNARDAMPRGGRLTFETANMIVGDSAAHPALPLGPYVLLTVSDTGTGMAEDVRQHIFEPFYTTKEKDQGTGLGLATVYGIVQQSGGAITVDSAPEKGTAFRIFLPCVNGGMAPKTSERTPSAVVGGAETILVVEDQPEVRQLTCEVLESYGYRVLQAVDGSDALRQVEAWPDAIDLAITDVVMPGMTGREFAGRLKLLRPEVKLIYMSGYAEAAITHRGVLDSGIAFLAKPFEPEELAAKVREVMGAAPRAITVLVADDEEGIRTLFQETLTEAGYEVLLASSGDEVMAMLNSRAVDLVVTDLVMPGQDGIDTIRALRREHPTVKTIAMSGAFGGQFLKTAELLGADATLSKPVLPERLISKVAEVCGGG